MLRADLFLRFFASSIGVTVNYRSHYSVIIKDDYLSRKQLGIQEFLRETKITGPNFIDWYRKLRLVLLTEDKENYLEHPILAAPVAPPRQQVPLQALAAHAAWVKGQKEELKAMYSKQAEQKLLQTVREFHTSKQEEGQSVSSHVLKMKGYIDNIERLGQLVVQNLAGLRGSKKLKPGALSLYVGDGHRAAVQAIGTYHLELTSGLVIVLNNCHYAPSITRGVISVSRLFDDGFINRFDDNNVISVSKNNLVYFMAVPQDGIFKIDMSCLNTNDSSMYAITNKRAKINLDFSLLWHCHLGHISKKRIEKLQHDGLHNSIDIESLGKCVSCMSGKMARKPYSHQVERAKDLLGLIHTDCLGNELRKTIKSLRSNHGDTGLNHEEDDQEIDEPQSDINPTRKSSWIRCALDRMCLYIDAKEHELGDLGEPANYKAALLDPESKKWLDVMNVEVQSMKDNDVWVLVELPPNARTVGSKSLFKKKTDMDNAVYIFKARLVAKGFTQTYGVDYDETFSPVVDIRAIRILIAIAAYYDYEIWQMDVKTAFLNGHLSEEVYMEQPEFDDEIKKFSFTQNPDEPCVYLKASGSYITILILYVDDILLMGNNIPMLQDVKSYLGISFSMKDLGEASYIHGIKIYRDRSKRLIGLCQKAYIEKILKRFYMENSKRGTIPMQEKLKLSKSQEHESRFQQNLGEEHWTAVKNILKYLRNTKDMFMTRYVFVLNGGAVDWKSTKQSVFTTSSTYAKYIAAFDASNEAVWIRKFIFGLGIVSIIEKPISDVKIEKIDTDDNLADPFTKALAFLKHSELTRNIRLLPASSFM
nr:hypothetical protein [Tanacetum cinerariifolium]